MIPKPLCLATAELSEKIPENNFAGLTAAQAKMRKTAKEETRHVHACIHASWPVFLWALKPLHTMLFKKKHVARTKRSNNTRSYKRLRTR